MNTQRNFEEVELLQLEPKPILSIRATIPVARLGEVMGERIQALSGYVQPQGIDLAGPPFVLYHTFGETETDMEFGVPVVEPALGAGPIYSGELPGGPAATTWHTGAHDRLGDAYARIARWIKESGREPDGPAREVYHWIDLGGEYDPSSWDPSTWHTQLIQPVK